MTVWLFAAGGAVIGALLGWYVARLRAERDSAASAALHQRDLAVAQERLAALDASRAALQADCDRVRAQSEGLAKSLSSAQSAQAAREAELVTTLQKERVQQAEKLELLNAARNQLTDAFKALSAEALHSNNASFLELARAALAKTQTEAKGDFDARAKAIETLVAPLRESLTKVDTQVQEMEKARREAYGALMQQVGALDASQKDLRQETANLVKALRSPATRGRWGEMQLRRVVELTGMLEYCDFVSQELVQGDDGRVLRPDLVVRMPGGMSVVVDAKTPLQGYLDALEATDEPTRKAKLQQHAVQLRAHMSELSSRDYWNQFQPTPGFVFLFLPGEAFYAAALEQDPQLIEQGMDQRVILAPPTMLITLLRVVAIGWRQHQLEQSAQEVSKLGKELYERLATLGDRFAAVRKSLDQSVRAYNDLAGSLESRVLPAARRFKDLGVPIARELEALEAIDRTARMLQTPELSESAPLALETPRREPELAPPETT
jgi:DNA recombination protein RmuC